MNSVTKSTHRGVANLHVIAEDYSLIKITDTSWGNDTHVTNYLSLLIDVLGLEDTVAYTAPDLIQKLSKEKSEIHINKFITNLKSSTEKLFILICFDMHWTFFYFEKNSKTLYYYNPYNEPPSKEFIDIAERIIAEAFGKVRFQLQVVQVPTALKQKDGFNCAFWIMAYIEILLNNKIMSEVVNFYITEMRNNVREIFEEITKSYKIPFEKFGIIQSTLPDISEFKCIDNAENDTVMIYKVPKKRLRSLSLPQNSDEPGPSDAQPMNLKNANFY